ncbi:MAG: hypothetical protein K8L91_09750 [Anaerolineae bacterium]|nr:hypothetical protein [Anaerolineae bacterium]
MTTHFSLGRYWIWGGLAFGGGLLLATVAALPSVNLWQTLNHLRAFDALLMMGGFGHAYVPLVVVFGIGVLTLLAVALLTPLALGFFVLDIHMELRQVCDVQGQVMHTERRLFCKLRRPAKAKLDDAPTRFLKPSSSV